MERSAVYFTDFRMNGNQNHQTKLQTYNQEVAQKASTLAGIEAELKARVASVKAEQKAAKSMQ